MLSFLEPTNILNVYSAKNGKKIGVRKRFSVVEAVPLQFFKAPHCSYLIIQKENIGTLL